MKTKNEQVKPEDRAELIRAARLAQASPFIEDFWSEVSEQLDRADTASLVKVEPR